MKSTRRKTIGNKDEKGDKAEGGRKGILLFVGGLIWVTIDILLAPRKGSGIRAEIAKRTEPVQSGAKEVASKAGGAIATVIEKAGIRIPGVDRIKQPVSQLVVKVRGKFGSTAREIELVTGRIISFSIEPGIGMRINPISKARA